MREAIIKAFPAYKIKEDGSVWSLYKPKSSELGTEYREVSPVLDRSSTGYLLVTLCHTDEQGNKIRKNKRIHRLLMEAFVPNEFNYPHINHIDGNKTNNSLDNLEWCSPKHNAEHAAKLGLIEPRTATLRVKVRQMDDDFNEIFVHRSLQEAENATGVARQNISKVVRGLRPKAGGFRWEYA